MRILLVEDDDALRAGLQELLHREGYEVVEADCAMEARQRMDPTISLVLLDVTLPDGDGISLCKNWRAQGVETPILFLTAKDEEMDVVRGLDAGGNDYVAKPFRMQELLSRIRVLLRDKESTKKVLNRSGIELHMEKMQAYREGKILNLTLTEYKILRMLMRSQGIVSREILLEVLWDADAQFVDDNNLSVHISRLREKVGAERIKTVRGVGYRWKD